MRARNGCASAFAIRASEVSPGGRFLPALPDGVDELVGMVACKRTRQSTYHPAAVTHTRQLALNRPKTTPA